MRSYILLSLILIFATTDVAEAKNKEHHPKHHKDNYGHYDKHCTLPPGLAKQGKVPPGWAKKCKGKHYPHPSDDHDHDEIKVSIPAPKTSPCIIADGQSKAEKVVIGSTMGGVMGGVIGSATGEEKEGAVFGAAIGGIIGATAEDDSGSGNKHEKRNHGC